jgi:hypothetical protein
LIVMTPSPVPSIIAAQVAAAERRIVTRFRDAGATDAAHAIASPAERHFETKRLAQLVKQGAVVESAPGMYYLDEPAYARHASARRRSVLIGLSIALVLLAVLLAVAAGMRL